MNELFTSHWQKTDFSSTDVEEASTRAALAPWLNDHGSLTEKLRAVCKQTFRVVVLEHKIVSASTAAASVLAIEAGDGVLQRQVLLCDAEQALVFACSLLPEAALTGRYEELRHLGSRPLGHWIFAEPVLTRAEMHYACIRSDSEIFANIARQKSSHLCGRKTLFKGAEKPFLVSEFFLPHLLDHYQA